MSIIIQPDDITKTKVLNMILNKKLKRHYKISVNSKSQHLK